VGLAGGSEGFAPVRTNSGSSAPPLPGGPHPPDGKTTGRGRGQRRRVTDRWLLQFARLIGTRHGVNVIAK
jgi:hypothetical protein